MKEIQNPGPRSRYETDEAFRNALDNQRDQIRQALNLGHDAEALHVMGPEEARARLIEAGYQIVDDTKATEADEGQQPE